MQLTFATLTKSTSRSEYPEIDGVKREVRFTMPLGRGEPADGSYMVMRGAQVAGVVEKSGSSWYWVRTRGLSALDSYAAAESGVLRDNPGAELTAASMMFKRNSRKACLRAAGYAA